MNKKRKKSCTQAPWCLCDVGIREVLLNVDFLVQGAQTAEWLGTDEYQGRVSKGQHTEGLAVVLGVNRFLLD